MTPDGPSDSERESTAGGAVSSPAQRSDGEKEAWHSEAVWRTWAGVRTVKSAHAALCLSPFGAAELATVQNESENGAKQEGVWAGDETGMENKNHVPDESTLGSEGAGISDDTLPYLSIGAKVGDSQEQAADAQGQRSTAGKAMRRSSTWPPAAAEWQARRKRAQEQEEEEVVVVRDVLDVRPPGVTVEMEKTQSCRRHLEKIEGVAPGEDDGRRISDAQPDVRHNHRAKPPVGGADVRDAVTYVTQQKEETRGDPAGVGPTSSESSHVSAAGRGFAPAAKAEKSTRRGVTPNDETLLSGNEYVFVDLLHEVVQNKGRWTRERWRQTHGCKPGRKERGADTHLK